MKTTIRRNNEYQKPFADLYRIPAHRLRRRGGGTVDPATQVLAPGTYKLAFTAMSSARLDAPVSGFDITVKLPAGLSVATTGGVSGQISAASLTAGSAIQTTSLAFGNYSVSTSTAHLSMPTTQTDFRSGEYLNMLFTIGSGTSVTPNDIYALNALLPYFKAVGLDTVSHTTVDLTARVKNSLLVMK